MTPDTSITTAIILAAGLGSRIRPLTDNRPKTLLTVGNVTILERMLTGIQANDIDQVVIVLGYLHEQIEAFVNETFPNLSVQFVINSRYDETNTGYSLLLAADLIGTSGFVKFDGDVVFDQEILERLLSSSDGNYLCIDRNIQLDAEEVKVALSHGTRVALVSKTLAPKDAVGESIGIERINADTAKVLFGELRTMMEDDRNLQAYYEAAYERLIANGVAFDIVDITGLAWTEIDTREDFNTAEMLFG
ncbi:MAG: choline kinase [Ilumatobacter sp.]|jgi:choline kinase